MKTRKITVERLTAIRRKHMWLCQEGYDIEQPRLITRFLDVDIQDAKDHERITGEASG
jgi:hypothetical protein